MLAYGLQHFAVSSFPANPPIGKTVFLSQASGDKQPGLYVWDGNDWLGNIGLPSITPLVPSRFPVGGVTLQGLAPKLNCVAPAQFYEEHVGTTWQVRKATDSWSTLTFDHYSGTDLISYCIPMTALQENTEYVWRAQCHGSEGYVGTGMEASFITGAPLTGRMAPISSGHPDNVGRIYQTAEESSYVFCEVSLLSGPHVVQASSGNHTLLLLSEGSIWVYGQNSFGQLGLGHRKNVHMPTMLGSSKDWTFVCAGNNGISLAIKTDGTLWAWGNNSSVDRPLGAENPTRVLTPVMVSSRAYKHVDTFGDTILAVGIDGFIYGSGSNSSGQMGTGKTLPIAGFARVTNLTNIAKVACGATHCHFLDTGGTLRSSGINTYGQLGMGNTTNRNSPGTVGPGFLDISAGNYHSAAIKSDGLYVWGMGAGYRQGADSVVTDVTAPTKRVNGTVLSTDCGPDFTLARTASGVLAFGSNDEGQLGTGSNLETKTPTYIVSSSKVNGVCAGNTSSLVF